MHLDLKSDSFENPTKKQELVKTILLGLHAPYGITIKNTVQECLRDVLIHGVI